MNPIKIMLLVLTVLATHPAWAAENGMALKAEAIKAEPFVDAKTVATLAVGDKVEILKRNADWLQVKSARGSGWVRLSSIRKGDATKNFDAARLLDLPSGRAGTGSIVASTGIRGRSDASNSESPKNGSIVQPKP